MLVYMCKLFLIILVNKLCQTMNDLVRYEHRGVVPTNMTHPTFNGCRRVKHPEGGCKSKIYSSGCNIQAQLSLL